MKVSYQKRWDDEGTVYDQCISMKLTELIHLQLAIESEIALGYPRIKEYCAEGKDYAKLFLKRIRVGKGAYQLEGKGLVYLNNTQRRFMELFLLKDVRARILDRNTCIRIN